MGGNREWLDWSEITVRDYRSSVQSLMDIFLEQSLFTGQLSVNKWLPFLINCLIYNENKQIY